MSLFLFFAGLALLVAAPSVKRAIFKRADAEGFESDAERRTAWQKAIIVASALRVAGGLTGLALTAITGSAWWSWGLGGAALIAMAMDWPGRGSMASDQAPGPK